MPQVSGAETIFGNFFYFKMSTLLKTNLRDTNFPELCEFWSIWQKSIPKKFSFQSSFAKVDTCKEISSNSFSKLIEITYLNYWIFNEKTLYIQSYEIWEITLGSSCFLYFLRQRY